jgi:proteasome lid subunit RPN8/RPN11
MPETNPSLLIPSYLLASAQDHANRDYPREACGFLIGLRKGMHFEVHEVWAATNSATTELQPSAYAIDPRDWMIAEMRSAQHGQEIIGIYHSHPDQEPAISNTDLVALWPNLIYLIVSSGSRATLPPMAWMLDENDGGAISCRLTAE